MSLEHRLLVSFLKLHTTPVELRTMVTFGRPPAIGLFMPPDMDILIVPHLCHPCIDLLKIELVTENDSNESELQIHTRYVALEELL